MLRAIKFLSYFLIIASALAGMTLSVSASAAEGPWLFEVGLNKSELDDPIDHDLSGVVDTGYAKATLLTNGFEKGDSINVGLGYKFGSILGVKANWVQLDNFETLTTVEIPDFPTNVLNNHEINIEGINLSLFAELPLSRFLYIRGEIGGFYYQHTLNEIFSSPPLAQGVPIVVPNSTYNPNDNLHGGVTAGQTDIFYLPSNIYAAPQDDVENTGTAISASFGTLFRITENIGVSLDYFLMNNIEDSSVKGLRAGIQYKF